MSDSNDFDVDSVDSVDDGFDAVVAELDRLEEVAESCGVEGLKSAFSVLNDRAEQGDVVAQETLQAVAFLAALSVVV